MVKTLSSSYGCCDLRTGCIILGYLEVVSFLIGVVSFAVAAVFYWPDYGSTDDDKRNSEIILLIASIVCLVSGITLLIGAYREDSDYVLAHLIIAFLTFILCLVSLFIPVLTTPWYFTLIGFLLMLWSLYHWLIAFSFYMEIL